jgi:hypothetical protein
MSFEQRQKSGQSCTGWISQLIQRPFGTESFRRAALFSRLEIGFSILMRLLAMVMIFLR